jgi:methionyl-tRNA synthetase
MQAVCDCVWKKIGELDEKITVTEPFKLVKTDKEKAIVLIEELVREVYNIGRMLAPIMPEANRVIKEAVLANKKPENLFNRLGA